MAPSISDILRETGITSSSPSAPSKMPKPHPLDMLSVSETNRACSVVKRNRPNERLWIKVCTLREPAKAELVPFLNAERAGESAARPAREADILFFELSTRTLVEAIVNLDTETESKSTTIEGHHAPLDRDEIVGARTALQADPEYLKLCEELAVPNATIVPQAWPYGADDVNVADRRLFFLLYHRNPLHDHPDSNHYAFPLPVVIFWDVWEKKITGVEWCRTDSESMERGTGPKTNPTAQHKGADYLPELNGIKPRDDLKPLHITQPEGVSFKTTGNLIEWQKWRFRLGFNYREGPTLHDVCYDGRRVFYRLSLSEMHVPYGDPRSPVHLRQVFDFGDIGLGRSANSLENGCDCLGKMQYFDTVEVNPSGEGRVMKNVVCCHEVDNGLLYKKTNALTGVAVVARQRLLVLQTIITVGNYDYIFAWHFDQAGALHLESRATGILSTTAIDVGKKSPYGTIVSPGVLGTSHQHFISLRIDPAVDGDENTVIQEDVVADPMGPNNPHGIAFRVAQKPITTSAWADASPLTGRSFKIVNPSKINSVSMSPVSYKLVPHPSQMRLALPEAMITSRAPFTQHHIWVTKYRDGELWAGGQYTNQSNGKAGGVQDMVDRKDSTENTDVVVWHTFGLTHVPRVEDFGVMPVETQTITLKPCNFFEANPAMDVPQSTQAFNKSQTVDEQVAAASCCATGNGM